MAFRRSVFFVNTPTTISVAVTTTALSAGQTLSAAISIVINGQPASQISFPVTLSVAAASILSANPSTLAFTALQGAFVGVPSSTGVSIVSSGAQLNYTITSTTTVAAFWLVLTNTTGTTGSSLPFPVHVNATNLVPGIYFGGVQVQSTTTSDSVTIPVTLFVSAGVPATPAPSTLVLVLAGLFCCWVWRRLSAC
jgi:hypothetical protein